MTNPGSPFPGPIPLSDKDKIFGRTRETAELIDRLTSDRFVLLYSPSGAGKSSLLYSGLIPVMRDRGFTTRKPIRVGVEPADGKVPFGLNRYVWSCAMSLEIAVTENLPMEQLLASPEKKELLVFDQFEEILTADPLDEKNRIDFFKQLGATLRLRGRYAVFALREDYLAPLQQYLEWLPSQLSSSMRLNVLAANEARSAIAESVGTTTVTIDSDAVDSLIKDLGSGGWVEPVQLQIVCRRLWDSLPENTTVITATMLGNSAKTGFSTESALEGYYADAVAAVAGKSGTPERQIRDWFADSLISPSGTRLQVVRDEEKKTTGTLPNAVVALLDNAHLVRSDTRRNTAWTELTHDRLIRPVTENNRAWKEKNLSVLQRDTEMWVKTGSSPDRLLRGKSLSEAKRWKKAHKAEVNDHEADYLARSLRARRYRWLGRLVAGVFFLVVFWGVWEAAAGSIESRLAATKQISNEAVQSSEDEPPAAAAQVLGGMEELDKPGIIVKLFGRSGLFVRQEWESGEQLKGALIAAAVEHDPRYVSSVLLNAPVDCLWFNPDGDSVSVLAGISSAAYSLKTGSSIPGPATTAPQPPRCKPPDEIGGKSYREDLPYGWKVFSQPDKFEIHPPSGAPYVVSFPAGSPSRMTVDPSGKRVAWVTGNDNYVYVINLITKKNDSLPAGDLDVTSLRFSPDGTRLAAGGRDQMVRVWQFKTGEFWGKQDAAVAATPLRAHYDTITDLAFSPDSQTLVSGGADRQLVQWHLPPELGTFVPQLLSETLAFMPGMHLSAEASSVVIRDDSGKITQRIPFAGPPVDTIALRHDGKAAAIIHRSGEWEVLDLATGKSLGGPPASLSTAQRIALSDDGKLVAVGHGSELVLWATPQNAPMDKNSVVARWAESPELDPNFKTEGLVFLPDGQELIESSKDNRLNLAKVSGKVLGNLDEISTRATVLEFAVSKPLGLIATLDEQRTIRFLSVERVDQDDLFVQLGGTAKAGGLKMPGNPLHIAFGADGKTLYVLMAGGKTLSWNLDETQLIKDACKLTGQPKEFKVCAK